MKYIKLFEELNIDEPKVGDWVICEAITDSDDELERFLSNTIGRIQNKRICYNPGTFNFGVYFEDLPKSLDEWGNPIDFKRNEIKFWSENKEDLEYIIAANKYNL